MSRFDTLNPLDSNDPRDRDDNSKNFDLAMNDRSSPTWIDRLGNERLSWEGLQQRLGEILIAGGRMFPTEGDGRADVDDGEYFFVAGDGELFSRVLYRRIDSSESEEVAAELSSSAVFSLRRVAPGNGYPDPNFIDLIGITGAPIERLPTNVDSPNSHYIIAEENADDFSLYTKTWPVIVGASYRYLTRYGNIFSGGQGEPMDVTLYVDYFSDHAAENLVSSRELSRVVSLVAETRVAYDTAPAGSVCARFRFEKVGTGGTNLIVSTLDVRQLVEADMLADRAHEGIANPGREAISATEERGSLTTSLAPGGIENRPPLRDVEAIAGASGPALLFQGLTTVARRRMIDLGPDVAGRRLRVDYLVSRRGPAAGGVAVDVEFGIAWYDNAGQVASTPETIHTTMEQIGFGITAHSFTFGRVAAADVTAPSDAYLAIPFVRFTTDSANALPLVRSIDVYLDQPVDSDDTDGGLAAIDHGDAITRFDLPLRISATEAEQLSPADRALREWYYIDGALVHRDDLPAFAPATPSATIDFPSGEAWTHTVDAGNSTITINARQSNVSGIARRLFAVQVDGVQGMTPTIHVTRADDWNTPLTLTRHRLAWSPDLDGDDWQAFDMETYDSGNNEWRFQNTYPFGFGRIYLANTPFYSFGRVLRKDMEWARNRYTRPTESSVGGYVIGTASARTAPYYSKPVPAIDHLAFRVGVGEKVVVLTSGVHPDEKPGYYQLEGCMSLILSETELGHRLRETFTFYVYPAINRQGLHAGAVRWEAETGTDANRIWGNTAITNDLRSIYEAAWAVDLGGKDVVAIFDFHSTAATNPATSNGAQLWYNHSLETPEETALLERMEGYRAFDRVEMSTTTSISAYMRSQFSPPITMTSEFTHARTDGIDDWRAWGRNIMRAMYDLHAS